MAKQPNPTDKYVGTQVRMRRKAMGLSQEKLGGALGITFQQIQKYEKGTNRVSASKLEMLAGALNVPVSYFFPSDENQLSRMSSPVVSFLMTDEGMDLASAMMNIKSSKLRRKLIELAKAMAEAN